jgi:hypothetical protein
MRYSHAHSGIAKELATAAARRISLHALTTPAKDFKGLCLAEIDSFETQRDIVADELLHGHGRLRSMFEEDALDAFETGTERIRLSAILPTGVVQ